MFIFSLVELLNFNHDNLVPSWHEARRENKKDPYFLHTGYGEKHQKANGTCSLKKVTSVPFMYVKYESKTS